MSQRKSLPDLPSEKNLKAKKEISVPEELEKFRKYLVNGESGEKAKQHLLYPLFQKLYPEKFKIETDAHGADVYIEGQLIIESKGFYSQWLEGLYQALHYHRKFGLTYSTIMIVAHRFVGIWKVNQLPETVIIYEQTSDINKPPNLIGRENAKRTQEQLKREIKESAFYWLEPRDLEAELFVQAKSMMIESYEMLRILTNLESERIQINTHNFIDAITRLQYFFDSPIEAIHAFYSIAAYWQDNTSIAAVDEVTNEVRVVGFKGHKFSPALKVLPRKINEFKKFIESHYLFTSEGFGLTVDYYFSRFDEVIATIDPEYVRQHGIFFTDNNLSKFALWFVKENYSKKFDEDYIVFDPAGGSGNLISNWKGKLKHKIISELQPDLLKIIERRMEVDPWHVEKGFTIVPKTSINTGLNFLDCSAEDYLAEIKRAVRVSTGLEIDKPIAFLLNPPYKNTDENKKIREETKSHYEIDKSIIELTGEDAAKERYLAFLGQILRISINQSKSNNSLRPIVMIFTPTSWLIPRSNFAEFRKNWDAHFKFQSGFIVASNEWFKVDGKWPIAFTIWEYNYKIEGNKNAIELLDLTGLSKKDLKLGWNLSDLELRKEVSQILEGKKRILFNNLRGSIKERINQKQYAFKRDPTKSELKSAEIFGGLPLKDPRRGNKKTYGISNSGYAGFMDDNTPVRVPEDAYGRTSTKPDRVWLQLRPTFIDTNLTKIQSGPQDKYGYCAYDLESAKIAFTWFGITKALNGVYPLWANQYDIWFPNILKEKENEWHSLCFAFALAENRCVTVTFEKDNPVFGAPEIIVDNPLCPTNAASFWNILLDKEIKESEIALNLVEKVKELYRTWNFNYCKGKKKENVGLQDEAYFKYFDYIDYLTPYSGLTQIKKFSEINGIQDLLDLLKELTHLTKILKNRLYELLIKDFKYFE